MATKRYRVGDKIFTNRLEGHRYLLQVTKNLGKSITIAAQEHMANTMMFIMDSSGSMVNSGNTVSDDHESYREFIMRRNAEKREVQERKAYLCLINEYTNVFVQPD